MQAIDIMITVTQLINKDELAPDCVLHSLNTSNNSSFLDPWPPHISSSLGNVSNPFLTLLSSQIFLRAPKQASSKAFHLL